MFIKLKGNIGAAKLADPSTHNDLVNRCEMPADP